MARSSTVDPIEKFRFTVLVIDINFDVSDPFGTLTSITETALSADKAFGDFLGLVTLDTVGFNEIILPKVSINEMSYRENTDAQRYQKIPGLAKYEPVTLKRGVTSSLELFNWYKKVNNDLLLFSTSIEVINDHIKAPGQNAQFRKEVIIKSLDREGNTVKSWILFNAWPVSYTPGNDLNSTSNEKLIQELTLTYEHFVEIPGGEQNLIKMLAIEAAKVTGNYLLDKVKDEIKLG